MDFDIPLDNPICCQGQTEPEPEVSSTFLENLTTTLKTFTIYGDGSSSRGAIPVTYYPLVNDREDIEVLFKNREHH